MDTALTIPAAFMVGLLGSVHCIGMCGGIVGALTLGTPNEVQLRPTRLWPYLILYNAGRIASYAAAGALAALIGTRAGSLIWHSEFPLGHLISAIFMILLGLYIGGWLQLLSWLERAGSLLWKIIEPLGHTLLPVQRPQQAFSLGLLWGWLPCGLVYSTLTWSFAAENPGQGALLMLAFGMGTLPMLLTMGSAAQQLGQWARNAWVRQLAGIFIISFGVFTVYTTVAPGNSHAHHGHSLTTTP